MKVWKRGESSLPYIQGQAAITAAIFIRFLLNLSFLVSYRLSHVGVAHETQICVESKVFFNQVSEISHHHLVFVFSTVLNQLLFKLPSLFVYKFVVSLDL